MERMSKALRAYGTVAANRSSGELEADVFRRANGALRAARDNRGAVLVRALADNRRLWNAVLALMYDPASRLPMQLRGSIASVGLAVQREIDSAVPNVEFLIAVNENVAAGLSGQG
jgi:flagellar biosynthesis regulator FlaF